MITEKRWLLTCSNERILSILLKFEGIEKVTRPQDVKIVWSKNKTPVCVKEFKSYNKAILKVPEFIDIDADCIIEKFTRWAHSHKFECGEFKTGKLIDTREEPCILCSIANHKGMSRQTLVYNEVVDKEVDCIIYESPRFFVTAELGALKPGYLMIIPKEHDFLSMAQLPNMYKAEHDEVLRDVETILKGAFGNKPVTFFEHGSGPLGLTSHKKSIVHAHTHVIIDFELKKEYLDMIQMKPLDDLSKARHTHYFAYKVGANGQTLCCYDDNVYIQRQFPRQIMAMELGYTPKQYNWREFSFEENIHTTLYYIYRYLATKNDHFRIAERTNCFVFGYPRRDDFEENC